MAGGLERLGNIAILAAALAIVVSVSKKHLKQETEESHQERTRLSLTEYVPEWEAVARDGLQVGDPSGSVHIVMFSDLECPFCAAFHLKTLPALSMRYPGILKASFVHMPIKSHRFATQAAQAVECASAQLMQRPFLDEVFRLQDSIGLKPWAAYGQRAGLRDSLGFSSCIAQPLAPRIAAGSAWGNKLKLSFTPSIMIEGWLFSDVPTEETITAAIDSILAAKGVRTPVVVNAPDTKSRQDSQLLAARKFR